MAHTPGPWKISGLDSGVNGKLVGAYRVLTCAGTDVPQFQVVARVAARTGETDANTNLIAAAPDLLAALTVAVETIRIWHNFGLPLDAVESRAWALYQQSPEMQLIAAALAKAKGTP